MRAEAAPEAVDLLTDFVGRPHIDADELDRERGVVIQEIQRYKDQPPSSPSTSSTARRSATTRSGARCSGPRSICARSRATRSSRFRNRRWAGARGGAFVVGNLEHVPATASCAELFERFPTLPDAEPFEPAPAFAPRNTRRGARHQPVASAHVLSPAGRSPIRPSAPRCRSTRRCWAAR